MLSPQIASLHSNVHYTRVSLLKLTAEYYSARNHGLQGGRAEVCAHFATLEVAKEERTNCGSVTVVEYPEGRVACSCQTV